MERIRITDMTFFIGIFAGLGAQRYNENLSLYDKKLERAIAQVFQNLLYHSKEKGVDIRFRIKLHWLHEDSMMIRDNILRLARMGIINLDIPNNLEIRIKLSKELAETILQNLPGGEKLFTELAKELIDYLEKNPVINEAEELLMRYQTTRGF
jgi:hypothetical protein